MDYQRKEIWLACAHKYFIFLPEILVQIKRNPHNEEWADHEVKGDFTSSPERISIKLEMSSVGGSCSLDPQVIHIDCLKYTDMYIALRN